MTGHEKSKQFKAILQTTSKATHQALNLMQRVVLYLFKSISRFLQT